MRVDSLNLPNGGDGVEEKASGFHSYSLHWHESWDIVGLFALRNRKQWHKARRLPVNKPQSDSLPQSNPFESPQLDETVTPATEEVLHFRWIFAFSGGAFGLIAKIIISGATGNSFMKVVSSRSSPSTSDTLAQHGPEVLEAILAGIGIGILFDSLLQRKLSRLMPGHWLLLMLVATLSGRWAWEVVSYHTPAIPMGVFDIRLYAEDIVSNALAMLFFVPVALSTWETGKWKEVAWARVIIGVLAVLTVSMETIEEPLWVVHIKSFMDDLLVVCQSVWIIVVFILGVEEVCTKRDEAKRRDAFHWLGLVGFCAFALPGIFF